MKRKRLMPVYLGIHGYIIHMQVYVRDQLTKNELQLFHLQLQPRDSIDTDKYMLSMQMWERHGKFPKLYSFQLFLNSQENVRVSPILTPVLKR